MPPRDAPLTVENRPPIRIFPSDCSPNANTSLLAPAPPLAKVLSSVPSAFSRAKPLRCTPLTAKTGLQPIRTFPSDCSATRQIGRPSICASNVVSSVPSGFIRAIPLRDTPLTFKNEPPIIIFPSDCFSSDNKPPLLSISALKVLSSVPSTFCRAIRR